MRVREWVFDRWFADLHEERLGARLEELRAAHSRSKEDEGWRRLSDPQRDLSPITHARMIEMAVYLWTYNPIAKRVLNTLVEWIVGEGVRLRATNDRTREYLGRFWDDPINRWDRRVEDKVRELFLFGEQFWPVFSNEFNGLMRLGVVDPSRVKEVVTDPDNVLVPIGVVMKSQLGGDERRFRTALPGAIQDILGPPALAERERFSDGEVLVNCVNKLSTQSRGVSELFVLADWLDGYEQLLFSLLSQERHRANFLWDVKVEGADADEIKERLKEVRAPKPFSVRMHNEKEEWKLVGPAFGSAANNTEIARLFRNHILGGEAIPEHWYGGGGDVNRATAAEMGGPAEKAFSAKQKTVKWALEDVLKIQAERGIEHGVLPDEEDVLDISLEFPELSARDTSKLATSIQSVAAGLALAVQEGFVDDEVPARVLAGLVEQMGVEVDVEEMMKKARDQKKDRLVDEASRAMDRRRLAVMGS